MKKTMMSILVVWSIFLFSGVNKTEAHVQLLQPKGGQFYSGQQVQIIWDVCVFHGPGENNLYLSTDSGASFTPIVEGLPINSAQEAIGQYVWTVPEIDSTECYIRVIYDSGSQYLSEDGCFGPPFDINDYLFSITTATSQLSSFEYGVDGFTGVRDNSIYSGAFENKTNGAGSNLFIGNNSSDSHRRTLISFDLSSIPKNSTILSASLELTQSKPFDSTSEISIHKLIKNWGEGSVQGSGQEGQGGDAQNGDATWLSNFHGSSNWDTSGGDYEMVSSASSEINPTLNKLTLEHPNLAADIQNWVNLLEENKGWIIIGNEVSLSNAVRFHSSNSATATQGQKPKLTVNFIPPSSGVPQSNWILFK